MNCSKMKNITLSADESLIEQARLVARAQHKTLNAAFREWLEQCAAQAGGGAAVEQRAIQRGSPARSGHRRTAIESPFL